MSTMATGSAKGAVSLLSRLSILGRYWRLPLVVILALVTAEILVRSAGDVPASANTMEPDVDLIWIPERGDPRDQTFEASNDGISDARTVVAVGDSSVYGFGVDESENFIAQLETNCEGRLLTLNCAGPGFSTYQSLRVLETVVPREHPDLVIIGNLWSDNNFDSFVDKELMATREKLSFRLLFHVNRSLSKLAIWRFLLSSMGSTDSVAVGGGAQTPGSVGGLRRVAINDYANNLWSMVDLVEEHGGEVLFLLLANEVDMSGQDFSHPWLAYRSVMRDVAAARGYPVVDVPALFRAQGLPSSRLFVDQMHPSLEGHELIAREIERITTQSGWFAGKQLKKSPREQGSVTAATLLTYRDPFAEPAP